MHMLINMLKARLTNCRAAKKIRAFLPLSQRDFVLCPENRVGYRMEKQGCAAVTDV